MTTASTSHGARISGKATRIPWTRALCPREGSFRVTGDGYPIDFRDKLGAALQEDVVGLEAAAQKPVLVVLGEAGIGKSDVAATVAAMWRESAGEGAVLKIDLGMYGDEGRLERDIFESPRWKAWLAGNGLLHLVLDSLDEALIGAINVVGLFQRHLYDLPFDRLRLLIACRTAAWPEILLAHLAEQFGSAADVGVYEVIPLLRDDVTDGAKRAGVDPEAFLNAVELLGAQPLASNPASLNLLLRLYSKKDRLPESTVEVYEKGLECLAEPTRARIDRVISATYSAAQLLEVATRLAGLIVLTGRSAIYIGASADAPPGAVPINEVAGGTEGDGGARVDVTESAVKAALRTGLFTARGPELFGPAHKSYGEFLAARHLSRSGLTETQRDSIIYAPDGGPRRVAPQLQETAAWLAGMDGRFFERLIKEEPELLVLSDVGARKSEYRKQVVDGLLDRTEAGLLSYDERSALRRFYGRLKHPGITAQLRRWLADPGRPLEAREVASDIAESCAVSELAGDLATIALDGTAPMRLRVRAGQQVSRLKEPAACARLKPLAYADAAVDPEDELRGLALRACWPDHMTAAELFRALEPPRTPLFGNYAQFLFRGRIADQIAITDLPIALEWAAGVCVRELDWDDLPKLASRIATRAWAEIGRPGIVERLAPVVLRRYREHACPFSLSDGDALTARSAEHAEAVISMIRRDTDSRRALLTQIVPLIECDRDTAAVIYSAYPLIVAEDFSWALERACASDVAEAGVWAHLARSRFQKFTADHVEQWLSTRARCPVVAEVFGFPLLVEMDSEEGRKAKAAYLERAKHEYRPSELPKMDRSPAEIVRDAAGVSTAGTPDGFLQLTQLLTLSSTGSCNHWAPEDIRVTPGWKEADPETRSMILRAARTFLGTPPDDPGEFLRREQGWPITDLLAPQAVLLLHHEEPAALASLPPKAWEGWAPNILVQFAGSFNCKQEQKSAICGLLQRQAPTVCRTAVLALIDRQRKATASPDIIHVWETFLDGETAAELVKRVEGREFSVPALCGLVAWLLRRRAEGVDSLVSRSVPTPPSREPEERERSIAIATAALRHAAGTYWPRIWQNFKADPEWGRAVVEKVNALFDQSHAQFLEELPELECGNLLEWMLVEYPPESDPVHRGVFSPGPAEAARELRRLLMTHLQARGTSESARALQAVRDAFPSYTWLHDVVLRSQISRRRRSWSPPTPQQLLRLAASKKARYVSSPAALLDLVTESLTRMENKLHGELPAAPCLWDEVGSAPTQRWRPKDEEHLSGYIARHLIDDLATSGIVANREVQIRRRAVAAEAGGAPGEKTDIYIVAVRPGRAEDDPEVFRVIIEVKGCWHPEVKTAMRTQLAQRYLRGNPCRHGAYIVGWFECPAWDDDDRRKSRVAWSNIEAARDELAAQARELRETADADEVGSLVIDCRLR